MLTASLYLLPNLITGVCINLTVGIFLHRLPAGWLVVISSVLCAGAPLMMALVDPTWKYYYLELWAQMLAPLGTNVLFTVGLIIVSTAAQFGTAIGVGVCQVVALGVMGSDESTSNSHGATSDDPHKMLRGYRASFWTMFASMVLCVLVAVVGLRRTGKVGVKKD
jgi:hypothetical protein